MKKHSALGIAAAAALGVVAVTAAPAAAAETDITFEVTGGALSISAPESVDLGTGSSGADTGADSLGTVAVADQRAGLNVSWTATAAATDFTNSTVTEAAPVEAAVEYDAGTVTTSGTVQAVPSPAGTVGNTPATVVTATLIVGANTASWNPTVSVTLPLDAVAGSYTGTITHSVS